MSESTQTVEDLLDPGRARALHAALDLEGDPPGAGDALPHFWHKIYFWDIHPGSGLGRDGHGKKGSFIPDTGLPRRMWAAGGLVFHAPVILGEKAKRISRVDSVTRKEGRSGPLAFARVHHRIMQGGKLRVEEIQDLVFRKEHSPEDPAPAPPPAPADEDLSTMVSFSPPLLFRYSALTFNGHRIHYDRDYCKEVEGYEGLIVHGPLQAQLLINLALRRIPDLMRFAFQATAPLYDFEPADLCLKSREDGLDLWVRGPGKMCMTAMAEGRPA